MDLCLAVRAPLDRWALVRSLDLDPATAMDLPSAHARLLHPTGVIATLVVLVRDHRDVAWLRTIDATVAPRRRPTVVAVVADTVEVTAVAAAGADAIAVWQPDEPMPGPWVLGVPERTGDLVLVLPERTAAHA